jgi:acetyl esterase
MVISAGFDPIRDDGLDYATRLRAAEVPVDLQHYPGQIHGFLNFDSVIDAGRDALNRIAAALNKVFGGGAAPDRTIEVADAPPGASAWPLRPAAELVMTSLTGWATAERVWLTLVGRLSMTADQAARSLLESRLVPGAFLRRSAAAQTHALEARQTWPHATSWQCAPSRKPHESSPPSAGAHAMHGRDGRKRSPKERPT